MNNLDEIIDSAHNQSADLLISNDFADDRIRSIVKTKYQAHTKEQIKALFLELVETPKGHIPDEECCNICDYRAELREKINNL